MELWCAVEIGRDFDLSVCALCLQAAQVFAGKQLNFFLKMENKAMKTKRRSVAFRAFCAFSVLSRKRSSLSPTRRRIIIARDYSRSSPSSSSAARPFPTLLGKF